MSDLASLLAARRQDAGDAVSFSSGTVELYNYQSGENQIRVGGDSGPLLVDVPVLNNAVRLAYGDTVALLRFKSAYFILGRISVPGAVSTFGGGSYVGFCNQQASGFSVGLTNDVKVADTIAGVPAWAKEGMVMVTGTVQAYNGSGAGDYLNVECRINGTPSYASYGGAGVGGFPSVTAHLALPLFPWEFDPAAPIRLEVAASTQGGPWGATAGNLATLSAIAIFHG